MENEVKVGDVVMWEEISEDRDNLPLVRKCTGKVVATLWGQGQTPEDSGTLINVERFGGSEYYDLVTLAASEVRLATPEELLTLATASGDDAKCAIPESVREP